MKTLILAGVAAASLTLAATGASAAPFSVSGGSAGSIPGASGVNDLLGPLGFSNPLAGFNNARVIGNWAGTVYKYEFLGAEASFHNQFIVENVLKFTHDGGTDVNLPVPPSFLSTSLDFWFKINGGNGGTVLAGYNDGANNTGLTGNFFTSINAAADQVVIWFDDKDDTATDDNHDDMVVRITAVPEPMPLAVIALGLIAVGLLNRRRLASAGGFTGAAA